MTPAEARLWMTSTFSVWKKIEITINLGSYVGSKGCDLINYDLELNLGQKTPFSKYTRWYIHSTYIISSSTTHYFLSWQALQSWN